MVYEIHWFDIIVNLLIFFAIIFLVIYSLYKVFKKINKGSKQEKEDIELLKKRVEELEKKNLRK
ncbi:FeoB-associated Cys-rich membrane protein [Anaerobacillus sp. MEB173]|uniref:FeoB-associated Cys-rich membrane protein n=1 Tax=Anaerobacillus sp. MEB173 TaxID=3383345 RepID=UPI003F8F26FE